MMMDFLAEWRLTGVVVGLVTFLIIGIFHPLVIYGEKRFTYKVWWAFLAAGIIALTGSLFVSNILVQSVMDVFAFSCFWAIKECFEQPQRRKNKELLKKIKEDEK